MAVLGAGLPNIIGKTWVSAGDNHTQNNIGALYYENGTLTRGRDNKEWYDYRLCFDASRWDKTYGAAKTVQPATLCLEAQFKF